MKRKNVTTIAGISASVFILAPIAVTVFAEEETNEADAVYAEVKEAQTAYDDAITSEKTAKEALNTQADIIKDEIDQVVENKADEQAKIQKDLDEQTETYNTINGKYTYLSDKIDEMESMHQESELVSPKDMSEDYEKYLNQATELETVRQEYQATLTEDELNELSIAPVMKTINDTIGEVAEFTQYYESAYKEGIDGIIPEKYTSPLPNDTAMEAYDRINALLGRMVFSSEDLYGDLDQLSKYSDALIQSLSSMLDIRNTAYSKILDELMGYAETQHQLNELEADLAATKKQQDASASIIINLTKAQTQTEEILNKANEIYGNAVYNGKYETENISGQEYAGYLSAVKKYYNLDSAYTSAVAHLKEAKSNLDKANQKLKNWLESHPVKPSEPSKPSKPAETFKPDQTPKLGQTTTKPSKPVNSAEIKKPVKEENGSTTVTQTSAGQMISNISAVHTSPNTAAVKNSGIDLLIGASLLGVYVLENRRKRTNLV